MHNRDLMSARYAVESGYEFRKWAGVIPALQFLPEWKIKVIPPFGGAIARFIVVSEFGNISVYLDAYDELGCMDHKPYWEIYPGADGQDPDRFWMNETEELIAGIKKALDRLKPKDVL